MAHLPEANPLANPGARIEARTEASSGISPQTSTETWRQRHHVQGRPCDVTKALEAVNTLYKDVATYLQIHSDLKASNCFLNILRKHEEDFVQNILTSSLKLLAGGLRSKPEVTKIYVIFIFNLAITTELQNLFIATGGVVNTETFQTAESKVFSIVSFDSLETADKFFDKAPRVIDGRIVDMLKLYTHSGKTLMNPYHTVEDTRPESELDVFPNCPDVAENQQIDWQEVEDSLADQPAVQQGPNMQESVTDPKHYLEALLNEYVSRNEDQQNLSLTTSFSHPNLWDSSANSSMCLQMSGFRPASTDRAKTPLFVTEDPRLVAQQTEHQAIPQSFSPPEYFFNKHAISQTTIPAIFEYDHQPNYSYFTERRRHSFDDYASTQARIEHQEPQYPRALTPVANLTSLSQSVEQPSPVRRPKSELSALAEEFHPRNRTAQSFRQSTPTPPSIPEECPQSYDQFQNCSDQGQSNQQSLIHVCNLDESLTETDLRNHFRKFGTLCCIRFLYDRYGRYSAMITYIGDIKGMEKIHIIKGCKCYLEHPDDCQVDLGHCVSSRSPAESHTQRPHLSGPSQPKKCLFSRSVDNGNLGPRYKSSPMYQVREMIDYSRDLKGGGPVNQAHWSNQFVNFGNTTQQQREPVANEVPTETRCQYSTTYYGHANNVSAPQFVPKEAEQPPKVTESNLGQVIHRSAQQESTVQVLATEIPRPDQQKNSTESPQRETHMTDSHITGSSRATSIQSTEKNEARSRRKFKSKRYRPGINLMRNPRFASLWRRDYEEDEREGLQFGTVDIGEVLKMKQEKNVGNEASDCSPLVSQDSNGESLDSKQCVNNEESYQDNEESQNPEAMLEGMMVNEEHDAVEERMKQLTCQLKSILQIAGPRPLVQQKAEVINYEEKSHSDYLENHEHVTTPEKTTPSRAELPLEQNSPIGLDISEVSNDVNETNEPEASEQSSVNENSCCTEREKSAPLQVSTKDPSADGIAGVISEDLSCTSATIPEANRIPVVLKEIEGQTQVMSTSQCSTQSDVSKQGDNNTMVATQAGTSKEESTGQGTDNVTPDASTSTKDKPPKPPITHATDLTYSVEAKGNKEGAKTTGVAGPSGKERLSACSIPPKPKRLAKSASCGGLRKRESVIGKSEVTSSGYGIRKRDTTGSENGTSSGTRKRDSTGSENGTSTVIRKRDSTGGENRTRNRDSTSSSEHDTRKRDSFKGSESATSFRKTRVSPKVTEAASSTGVRKRDSTTGSEAGSRKPDSSKGIESTTTTGLRKKRDSTSGSENATRKPSPTSSACGTNTFRKRDATTSINSTTAKVANLSYADSVKKGCTYLSKVAMPVRHTTTEGGSTALQGARRVAAARAEAAAMRRSGMVSKPIRSARTGVL